MTTVLERHPTQYISRLQSGSGDPILFIPGFLETSCIWSHLVQRTGHVLPDCHTMSLPGHPPWILSPQDVLSDNWIDQLGEAIAHQFSRPVRLVGHSTGGLVALELALARPDLVKDIMLVGALSNGTVGGYKTFTHGAAEHTWLGPYVLSAALQVWLRSERSFRAGLLTAMARPVPDAGLPLDMRAEMRNACPRTLHALLRWMGRRNGDALGQVACPVTSVIGTNDCVVSPLHQMETARAMSNVLAILLPTGHLPFLERPDLFDPVFTGWVHRP